EEHVVEDGGLITSAGISAGIDMALRVVARHHGEAVARATARHMEYPYPQDNRRRVWRCSETLLVRTCGPIRSPATSARAPPDRHNSSGSRIRRGSPPARRYDRLE